MSDKSTPQIAPEPELLEAVYRTAVTPDSYDTLMARWQQHIEKAVEELGAEREREPEGDDLIEVGGAMPHFETSFQILEALGREREHPGGSQVFATGKPKFMLDPEGRVVWFNGIAARDLKVAKGMAVSALPVGAQGAQLIENALAGLTDPQLEPRPFIVAFESGTMERSIHMLVTVMGDQPKNRTLMFDQADVRWTDQAGKVISDAFGLSASEAEITGMLVEGRDLNDIAEIRGRTVATVRTQLKSILKKTHTHSQNELLRLCTVLSAHMPANVNRRRIGAEVVRFHVLPCGRSIPYHTFGPEDGKPVVFLHGMLDGVQVTDQIQALLNEYGLRLIGPERPFFGSAEGPHVPTKHAMTAFADDLHDMIETLGLDRFVVVGHMAGAVPAHALAGRFGDRVAAVVAVAGGLPIVSADQFKVMSPRQRMVAYTARYTPSALPFILRAGIRQLDHGGAKKFMDALYVASQPDQQACARGEIFNIVSGGYRYAIAQGHRAFEIDSYHVVRDWSHLIDGTDRPIHLIHGAHDPVVRIETVRAFARRYHNRAVLHEHPEAGQLVYYAEPDFVLPIIAGLFDED